MSKRRNMITASVGAAVAAGIVTVSAVAGAASAPTTHTIRLIATHTASHNFSRSSAVVAETDRHNGKVIGYDVVSFIGTGHPRLLGSFATRGGVINFRIPLTNTKTLHGKVTGGLGRFAGISGTVAATPLNKANTRTAVKIVYHH
jgi:hypothetical protein